MKLPSELTTVTPFSKKFALLLFITLPFYSFFLGLYYAKSNLSEKIYTEIETNVITPTKAQSQVELYTFENEILGYKISYPKEYNFSEAKIRKDKNTQWVGAILQEDEVEKISFSEKKDLTDNYGHFELSVLYNPDLLTLDQWVFQYRTKRLTATGAQLVREVKESTLGEKRAIEMTVFGFDHSDAVVATLHNGLIYTLTYNSSNPNDPSFEEHHKQYLEARNSFTFFQRNE